MFFVITLFLIYFNLSRVLNCFSVIFVQERIVFRLIFIHFQHLKGTDFSAIWNNIDMLHIIAPPPPPSPCTENPLFINSSFTLFSPLVHSSWPRGHDHFLLVTRWSWCRAESASLLPDPGTQLLEVYALEIQMYTAQKNNKVMCYKEKLAWKYF